jgi:hypothetical protein
MQQRDVSEAGQNFQLPWLRNLMRMRRVYRTGFSGNRLIYALDTAAPPFTKNSSPSTFYCIKCLDFNSTQRNR